MRARRRAWTAITALAVCGLVGPPARALAQQASPLERAEELARAGALAQARALVLEWWEEARADASRPEEQRALWLRARLTVDPAQAMLDYQRLVVLYPTGVFADQALLRLAQGAHALGDVEAARAHVAQLVRDYPGTAARRSAETWLAAAGEPRSAAAESPDAGAGSATGNTRAAAAEPQAVVPAGSVGAGSATGAGAPGAQEAYSVQLGAFGDLERALAVRNRAAAAGFDPRLVRVDGSLLLHVRVGAFVDRDPAQALLDRITAVSLEGAIVRDPRPERPAS